MMQTALSLISVYIFIVIGFFSKLFFKEKLNEKTLVILSVYILQPFLTFWGLLKKDIDFDLIFTPIFFIFISISLIFLNIFLSSFLFEDKKKKSISTIAGIIGNTGNLGIPLGIAIFGENSIAYTTMINLANVFIVYTFGVYFYSRGEFDIKSSLLNIIKLPILWFAILAIIFNIYHIPINSSLEKSLEMGAYASIVIQLMIFGIYLNSVKIKELDLKLLSFINITKFITVPIISFLIIKFLPIENFSKAVLFMETIMPLAVTNVNLSALYNCRPKDVTAAVFSTSILFLILIFLYLPFIQKLMQN
ncbi:AEC family transporter [Nitrosophilus kaiyonis]|uniref:AEC family transporter n=1 Tax=Nitrosophilus kaiyonis TaxID=2930200 RepID=UPI0024906302|nr:AEC family transporter [Nitrosophilus kaiyonis]